MVYQHTFQRHRTREVRVGDTVVGGSNPIWVQSMTTTDTYDVEATVAEIHRMEEAGCEIVRVTVPKAQDAAVLGEGRSGAAGQTQQSGHPGVHTHARQSLRDGH